MYVGVLSFVHCFVQFMALMGKYTKFLFDLNADPNERNNLYFNDKYSDIKVGIISEVYSCDKNHTLLNIYA